MTGPCSGAVVGTAKPGFAELQYVGPAAIGGALAGLSGWAGAAAGATLGLLSYELSTFCPNGPPAAPTFDADDAIALLNPADFLNHLASIAKVRDIVGIVMWPLLCECPSGTITIDPVPVYPTGGPQQYPAVVPCADKLFPYHSWTVGSSTAESSPPTLIGTMGGKKAMSGRLVADSRSDSTAGHTNTVRIKFFNSVGTLLSTQTEVLTTPYSIDVPLVIPAATESVYITNQYAGVSGTQIDQEHVTVWCGPGSTVAAACAECPPDPTIVALLEQVLELVTITQRQAAPFAYIAGTEHASLTGDDEFDVFGLLGVRVQLDTIPDTLGVEDGNPVRFFDLGWVALGTEDGWFPAERIQHQQQIVLHPLGGVVTRVGYFLKDGVTISITELRREF